VTLSLDPARHGPPGDQCLRPLGIHRREHARHLSALRAPVDDGAVESDLVHDCTDVVRSLFERGDSGRPVREPSPPLVEADEAGERAPRFDLTSERSEVPPQVEMGDRARREHDVDRSFARDLKRDLNVATAGEPDRRALHRDRFFCILVLAARSPAPDIGLSSE
jgi:hypothetical protein